VNFDTNSHRLLQNASNTKTQLDKTLDKEMNTDDSLTVEQSGKYAAQMLTK